jgi:hypothetical protein
VIDVNLKKINLADIEDQLFLYDILKFRWKAKETINIKHKCPDKFPSFDEHQHLLFSGKYKVFYKIMANDISIGTIYIDKNDVNGTFIIPELLKRVLKKHKNQKLNIQDKSLSAYVHIALFKLHPEIKVHYASVNPNNKLSLKSLIDNGYELIESILAIKTEDGKVVMGKWKETDDKPIQT